MIQGVTNVTVRLIPSTYSAYSGVTITSESNMYNNVDNTTYTTLTHTSKSTNIYYVYIKGFNFDDIPDTAIVNSFSIKIKARASGLSVNYPSICNGQAELSSSASNWSTSSSPTTITFTNVSNTFSQIKKILWIY